jgi:HlyD family secretion protein
MRRLFVIVAVLGTGLLFALAYRIRAQEAAETGPVSGSGIVEGDAVDHASRIASRISRIAVEEGDTVAAGDLLVELDCAEPNARLAEASARLAAAEAQLEAARAQVEIASRARRAASSAARAGTISAEVAETNASAALRESERAVGLGEYVSDQRRDALADSATAASLARDAAASTSRASRANASVAAAQILLAEANARAAAEAVAAVRAVREVAAVAVAECSVHAARAGVVENVYFEAGEVVAPGATLVRVVDLSVVNATFYVPNGELGALTVGGRATVVADAFEGRSFEAEVVTVSTEAEFTPRTIQTRTDRDRLVYPVEVRIPNPEGLLRPGMPVEVTLPSGS